jgi:hypothetical protein
MPREWGSEVRPSREQFAEEAIRALRAAGLEGPIEVDDQYRTIGHAERGAFDLENAYQDAARLPREQRVDVLGQIARWFVNPPALPDRWEDAREKVLPNLKPRIAIVTEEVRRQIHGNPLPVPLAEITPHLVFELAFPCGSLSSLTVPQETLERWGVDAPTAFAAAGKNLERMSLAPWQGTEDAPGVFISPWNDGRDASRLFLPRAFARLRLRGRPVALAPAPSRLLVAGAEDEDGIFQLARLARRLFEQHRGFYVFRAVRMGDDGESWAEWLPPATHAAHDPLRFLRAINEVSDYDRHASLVRKLAAGKHAVMPLPRLHLLQGALGAEVVTVTTWKAGKPQALPKADVILFQREGKTLGYAPWEDAVRALPSELKPLPGYPVRHLAADFPEEWQMGSLGLRPWEGRLPE